VSPRLRLWIQEVSVQDPASHGGVVISSSLLLRVAASLRLRLGF